MNLRFLPFLLLLFAYTVKGQDLVFKVSNVSGKTESINLTKGQVMSVMPYVIEPEYNWGHLDIFSESEANSYKSFNFFINKSQTASADFSLFISNGAKYNLFKISFDDKTGKYILSNNEIKAELELIILLKDEKYETNDISINSCDPNSFQPQKFIELEIEKDAAIDYLNSIFSISADVTVFDVDPVITSSTEQSIFDHLDLHQSAFMVINIKKTNIDFYAQSSHIKKTIKCKYIREAGSLKQDHYDLIIDCSYKNINEKWGVELKKNGFKGAAGFVESSTGVRTNVKEVLGAIYRTAILDTQHPNLLMVQNVKLSADTNSILNKIKIGMGSFMFRPKETINFNSNLLTVVKSDKCNSNEADAEVCRANIDFIDSCAMDVNFSVGDKYSNDENWKITGTFNWNKTYFKKENIRNRYYEIKTSKGDYVKLVFASVYLDKIIKEYLKDKNGPEITLIEPKQTRDLIIASKSKNVYIKGSVRDENKVKFLTVNNMDVPIVNNGFEKTLSLSGTTAKVTIQAIDEFGNITVKEFEIELPSDRPADNSTETVENETDRSPKLDNVGNYFALVIGVNKYTDKRIPQLDNPIKDAKSLKNTLVQKYTFENNNVVVLENPDRKAIFRALVDMKSLVGKNDNFLLFYAGHGFFDKEMDAGYWLPADSEKDSKSEWISFDDIIHHLRAINSKHTLVVSDACFSGGFLKERSISLSEKAMYDLYQVPSRKVITSGNLTTVPDESVFMKYLVKALNENSDKYLTEENLFERIKIPVVNNSETTPLIGILSKTGDEGGNFIFIKR
jgi:hypothetical protein